MAEAIMVFVTVVTKLWHCGKICFLQKIFVGELLFSQKIPVAWLVTLL